MSTTADKDPGTSRTPNSQNLDDSSMIQVAQEINRLTKIHHEEKRNKLHHEYSESIKTLRAEIEGSFDGLSERISKAHTLRVEKLVKLVRERGVVEREMMACAKRLEIAGREAGREVLAVLDARVRGEVGGGG